MKRPFIVLKVATSLDGYLDDLSEVRRVFSDAEDRAAVEKLRADADAILVGAGTVRLDNPRLCLRDEKYIARRREAGKKGQPLRVVLSETGELSPSARIFSDEQPVLLYTSAPENVSPELCGKTVTVRIEDSQNAFTWILSDLKRRGVSSLLIEGGSSILGQCVSLGCFDLLRIATAPEFVGQAGAPRLVPSGAALPPGKRLHLESAEPVGRMTVLTYTLSG